MICNEWCLIFFNFLVCVLSLILLCFKMIKNDIIMKIKIIINGIFVSIEVVFNIFNVCLLLISINENGNKYNVNV